MIEKILILGGASPGGGAGLVMDAISQRDDQIGLVVLDNTESLHGKQYGVWSDVNVEGPTDERTIRDVWDSRRVDSVIIAFAGNIRARMNLYKKCVKWGLIFTNVIHPSVVVSNNVLMGTGNVIMAHSYLGPNVWIGNNNFMSSYTGIEHDCVVGSHNTFGPGVKFSGCVTVGSTVLFGMNIGVQPRLKIGNESIVSSGCVLTADVEEKTIVKVRTNHDRRKR